MSHSDNAKGQQVVEITTEQLLHFYSVTEEDRPESVNFADPNPAKVVAALKLLIDVMFPGRSSGGIGAAGSLKEFLQKNLSGAWQKLQTEIERAIPYRWHGRAASVEGTGKRLCAASECGRVIEEFFGQLPDIRALLLHDVQAAYDGDPAALTFAEVKSAYPGLLAIASHRLAHALYRLDVPVIPRIMSEWTHTQTGIDIHPGAKIGRGFFIDHGTGVDIGETAELGEQVKLYQGVTLGAKSFPLDSQGRPVKHIKRHPTVEDRVVIYSNASILGGDTVIGSGSVIGGNVFLTESVPPGSVVVSQSRQPHIKIEQSKE